MEKRRISPLMKRIYKLTKNVVIKKKGAGVHEEIGKDEGRLNEENFVYLLQIVSKERGKKLSIRCRKDRKTPQGISAELHMLYHGVMERSYVRSDVSQFPTHKNVWKGMTSYYYPVFYIDKDDDFINNLLKKGDLKVDTVKHGALKGKKMAQLFVDEEVFKKITAKYLNKYYLRQMKIMLMTYAHPDPPSEMSERMSWPSPQEARTWFEHYTDIYNYLVSVLTIIDRTNGQAMIRERLMKEEEKKLVRSIANYYLPHLEWEHQIHLLIGATTILKKTLSRDNPDREINAKNLAEFLNTYKCKNNKREEYGIKFDAKRLLEVVDRAIEIEKMREKDADKVQKGICS